MYIQHTQLSTCCVFAVSHFGPITTQKYFVQSGSFTRSVRLHFISISSTSAFCSGSSIVSVCVSAWVCLYSWHVKETTSKVMKKNWRTNKSYLSIGRSAVLLLLRFIMFSTCAILPRRRVLHTTRTLFRTHLRICLMQFRIFLFLTFLCCVSLAMKRPGVKVVCLLRWWSACKKEKENKSLSLSSLRSFFFTFCLMACVYVVRVCSVHLRCSLLLTESTWNTSS